MSDHTTMVEQVELMSVSVCSVDGKPSLVLTMRLDPNKFESNNIAISAEQAIRLQKDLEHIFKTSESMKNAAKKHSDSKEAFDKIIFG